MSCIFVNNQQKGNESAESKGKILKQVEDESARKIEHFVPEL